jgi:hypothetical protein
VAGGGTVPTSTRSPVPSNATLTYLATAGDHTIEFHWVPVPGSVTADQVTPSGELATPPAPTATNSACSGDQVTANSPVTGEDVCVAHVAPSLLVWMPPADPTATYPLASE